MSQPKLAETMSNQDFYAPRKNPEKLSSKKRLLYEIEQILDMEEKGLQLDVIESKSRHSRRIPNRDIYRLYKAILQEKKIQPRVIYTGKDIMSFKKAENLVKDSDKTLEALEPTI
jgi:hypothetical protein